MNSLAPLAIRFALLVAAYLLGAELAVWFIDEPGEVTLIWPPAGIGFAALLVYGVKWWPFIAVAVLLVHASVAPVPLLFVPYSVAANVLGAAIATLAVRRHALRNWRTFSVESGMGLLAGGLLMAGISSLIGATGMVEAGMVEPEAFWPAAAKWTMGDLFGLVAVTPAMLLLAEWNERRQLPPLAVNYAGWAERTIWLLALSASIFAMLWAGRHSGTYVLGLASLPLALLMWSALRFEPLVTSLATMGLSLFVGTLVGLGVAGFSAPESLLDSATLLGFLCITAVVPQMLAAAGHQNRLATLRLVRRATTDPLTGLPNRQAFEDKVRALTDTSSEEEMALAYLDLDQFKLVNDTASHSAGDALMRGLVGVLETNLPEGDVLARVGGDEFAVLMRRCPGSTALARAQRLREAVADFRLGWSEHVFAVTASIGLVPFRPGTLDFPDLLARVDAACFTAKELGGNRVQIAAAGEGEVHARTTAMRWAVRINGAIENDGFELFCQSIVPLRGDRREGRHFEILLRMRDEHSGELLLPGEFVAAAERFNLGPRLDRHVVDRCLRWLETHPGAAADVDQCSINLSAAAVMDDEFGLFLRRRLASSRLPPEKLCFELTETSAVRELARAQTFIQSVRALGCRFALDDFGTGFCSFAYLRALDVDIFKIDGSFVSELIDSPLALAIVRSIADIGRVMDKRTVAECVESEAVRARLGALGVDYAQGWAIDRPQPIDDYFATPVPRYGATAVGS